MLRTGRSFPRGSFSDLQLCACSTGEGGNHEGCVVKSAGQKQHRLDGPAFDNPFHDLLRSPKKHSGARPLWACRRGPPESQILDLPQQVIQYPPLFDQIRPRGNISESNVPLPGRAWTQTRGSHTI